MTDINQRLADWTTFETLAERILPIAGRLYRERGVVCHIHGISLIHKNAIEIVKAHRYTRKLHGEVLDIRQSLAAVEIMAEMHLGAARVDLAKLVFGHREAGGDFEAHVKGSLASIVGGTAMREAPQDVVLYGFGRIGRLLARLLVDKAGAGDKFRLRAIVTRPSAQADIHRRASLLRRDSVHGHFMGSIQVDEARNALIANGNQIDLIYASSPDAVDYEAHGIHDAIVIDNTGKWRDREGLSLHLAAKGVAKVILTAPGKGDLPNIVHGVNHESLTGDEDIVSAASCTTNAIVPVLKALNDRFGIECGHIETIHAYTNDQNLIDNYHSKARRGRAAALNMVITETGAATAVAKALPELAGKLTGNAIRVPTPNVSLAILNLNLKTAADRAAINTFLRETSLDSPLHRQIDYTTAPDIVSSDLVGNRHACVVDASATIVAGDRVTLYCWYDNEYGYSCQVLRLLQQMAGVTPPSVP